jgi:hypothetical protein
MMYSIWQKIIYAVYSKRRKITQKYGMLNSAYVKSTVKMKHIWKSTAMTVQNNL